jgi:hypothetical protein
MLTAPLRTHTKSLFAFSSLSAVEYLQLALWQMMMMMVTMNNNNNSH